MTFKTWIELEFEVEADYIPEEAETRDCPGSNSAIEIISVTCVDPRATGTLEIPARTNNPNPKVQAEVDKLLDSIEQEGLKEVEEKAEDPRI